MIRYKIKTVNNEYLFEDFDSMMQKYYALLKLGYSFQLFYKGFDGRWYFYNRKRMEDE